MRVRFHGRGAARRLSSGVAHAPRSDSTGQLAPPTAQRLRTASNTAMTSLAAVSVLVHGVRDMAAGRQFNWGDNRVDNPYIHADIHVPSPRSVLDLEAHRPCFGTKRSNRQLVAAQLPPIRHDTVVTRSVREESCWRSRTSATVSSSQWPRSINATCQRALKSEQHGRAGWS